MTRRTFLETATASIALQPALAPLFGQDSAQDKHRTKMGIATTSYMTALRPRDTYQFLEHCYSLGASGIQSAINGDLQKIRSRAEQLGMYIEAMVSLPKNGDTSVFEQSLKNAGAAGASCLRAANLSGRRYETFSSLEDWKTFVEQSHRALDTALPMLEKYRIPLGLENHKDRTADELHALIKKYSSEYLGVCLDFGNNISLLDEPMDVIQQLAPFAVATHVKDMGVEPYDDGFLLSEVRLGTGFLDLSRMIAMVQEARPQTHLSLEMITRDPLKVPCLTDKYWATFPTRNGEYLARTLKLIQKESAHAKSLPRVSQLDHAAQVQAEENNVKACLAYARETLHI